MGGTGSEIESKQALAQCRRERRRGREGEGGWGEEEDTLTCELQVQQKVLRQLLLSSKVVQLYQLAHSRQGRKPQGRQLLCRRHGRCERWNEDDNL